MPAVAGWSKRLAGEETPPRAPGGSEGNCQLLHLIHEGILPETNQKSSRFLSAEPRWAATHSAYSFLPFAGWPRRRNVFGYFPSPQILNVPKSLYQAPSGASGSDSRHNFNSYKSSTVILRSRRRSKRWSRRVGGKSDHWIFGIYSPNVRRASSFLIRFRSAGSEESLNRSASWKNFVFSASLDSIPLSISSTKTRFVLVRRCFAIVRTWCASREGSDTLRRKVFFPIVMGAGYTKMHHFAPKRIEAGATEAIILGFGFALEEGIKHGHQEERNER